MKLKYIKTAVRGYIGQSTSQARLILHRLHFYRYADGYLRFTVRNNVELMTPHEANVEMLIKELEAIGLPVGGAGPLRWLARIRRPRHQLQALFLYR